MNDNKDSKNRTDLSIVIAAWPDNRGLTDCWAALEAQLDNRTEVIFIGLKNSLPDRFEQSSRVRWITHAKGLIPDLWGVGLREAGGDVIALTTAHFRPAPDWVSKLRSLHLRLDSPAIGGAIKPPQGGSLTDWATYFLRYSGYLEHIREKDLDDLAGDNVSYKRIALEENQDTFLEGFWEIELHRRLLRQGQRLTFSPELCVTQTCSFGFWRFLHQRFLHGQQFGASRMSNRHWAVRSIAVLAFPLIFIVFLAKIVRRVIRGRKHFLPFLASLPALSCFLTAWAAGEIVGYLRASKRETHLTTEDAHNQPISLIHQEM